MPKHRQVKHGVSPDQGKGAPDPPEPEGEQSEGLLPAILALGAALLLMRR